MNLQIHFQLEATTVRTELRWLRTILALLWWQKFGARELYARGKKASPPEFPVMAPCQIIARLPRSDLPLNFSSDTRLQENEPVILIRSWEFNFSYFHVNMTTPWKTIHRNLSRGSWLMYVRLRKISIIFFRKECERALHKFLAHGKGKIRIEKDEDTRQNNSKKLRTAAGTVSKL